MLLYIHSREGKLPNDYLKRVCIEHASNHSPALDIPKREGEGGGDNTFLTQGYPVSTKYNNTCWQNRTALFFLMFYCHSTPPLVSFPL